MMDHLGICRVCLVRNVKLYSLREAKLEETYELFSCTKINPEDGKPETICYMCLAQLVKCSKFRARSQNAVHLLTKIFEDKFQLTPETSILLDNRTHLYLTQSAVQHTSFDDTEAGAVKEEYSESADDNDEIPLTHIKKEAKKLQETKMKNTSRIDIDEVKFEKDINICLKKEGLENLQNQRECDNKPTDEADISFHCTVCNKKHVSKKTLDHHMKVHDRSRPFPCEICAYRFKTKDYLIKHTKTVHIIVKETVTCSVCHKLMNSPQILKRHMKNHALVKSKTHACDKCDLKFSQKSTLVRHKATHTEGLPVKPHSCPICGKIFSVIYNLQNHLKLHSGEKPFTCEKCGKAYTLNSHLKIHMRTHTGEKPYSCTICQKPFAEYTNMKTHMATHSGEKPYTCDRCGKTFTKKCSMKKHIQYVHLKEKSHNCDMCTKSYAKRQALRDHMRYHTGERPYKCEKCCKTFMTNDYIKRHMKTHSEIKG